MTDPSAPAGLGYDIHGVTVSLESESPGILAAIQSRLELFPHMCPAPDEADVRFVVRVIDGGCDGPAPGSETQGRLLMRFQDGQVRYAAESNEIVLDYGERSLVRSVLDTGRVDVSAWPPVADQVWAASHPCFLLPLLEQLKWRGLFSVHAAGFVIGERALVLAGPTGSGKSTLSIALLRAGIPFLGDDTLLLRQNDSDPRVLAFPDEVDVTLETAQFFPELAALTRAPLPAGYPKHPLRPEKAFNARVTWECAPGALVFPRVVPNDRSRVTPMSPEEALIELASNVLLTNTQSSQRHLSALAQLARRSRCYRLETGRDLDALPTLLSGLVP